MSGPPDAPTTARRRPSYSTTVGDMLLSGFLPVSAWHGKSSSVARQTTKRYEIRSVHNSEIVKRPPHQQPSRRQRDCSPD